MRVRCVCVCGCGDALVEAAEGHGVALEGDARALLVQHFQPVLPRQRQTGSQAGRERQRQRQRQRQRKHTQRMSPRVTNHLSETRCFHLPQPPRLSPDPRASLTSTRPSISACFRFWMSSLSVRPLHSATALSLRGPSSGVPNPTTNPRVSPPAVSASMNTG
eukprot:1022117-Rhodomonas_salina.1